MHFIILYKRHNLFKLWFFNYYITSNTVNTYQKGSIAMKLKKNSSINMLGEFLINLSEVIVSTASFGLAGEPKPPKSLLK